MPHQKFLSSSIKPRYSKGHISVFGINSVYPRIPWVAAWWSFAFPGFGHMYIGKYLHGFILIIWELIVNNQSNLNMGIALSFLGRFDEAKAQINQDWGHRNCHCGLAVVPIFAFYVCFCSLSSLCISK